MAGGIAGSFLLARAAVSIRADDSRLRGDFQRARSNIGRRMAGLQAFIASRAGAALAGFGAALALRKVIGASQQAIAIAKVHVAAESKRAAVLKATGEAAGFSAKQLTIQAKALSAITTLGVDDITNTQAIMLTFTQVTGEAFLRANELVADMAQTFGGDAKSAAIQLGKALNDPVVGVGALAEIGVSFNAMQKEQIKNFVAVNDLASAQAVIMDELAREFGGAAKAFAGTDAGKLIQLTNASEKLSAEIGKKLLPAQLAFSEASFAAFQATSGLADVVVKLLGPMQELRDSSSGIAENFKVWSDAVKVITLGFDKFADAIASVNKNLAFLKDGGILKLARVLTPGAGAIGAQFFLRNEPKAAAAGISEDELQAASTPALPSLAVAGAGPSGERRDLGFVGLQDLGKQIQENLLAQQQEQREEEQLQETKEQSQTLDKISATMDRVDAGIARLSTGVVKSRGTA